MPDVDEAIALVSLDDVKEFLQVTADTFDSVLGDLINSICAAANSYTGRYLASKSYIEYYDAEGMLLALKNYPVTALTSIYDDPAIPPVFGVGTLVSSTDYQVDKESGLVRRLALPFYGGIGNAKVTYVAGYTLTTVPYDLALALKKWIAPEYIKTFKEPARIGVTQFTQGDRTTTYSKDAIPADVVEILNRYRRVGSSNWGIA